VRFRLPTILLRDRHALSRGQAAWLAIGSAAASALAMYFLDPERGRRRRHMLRDRAMARERRMLRVMNASWRRSAADVSAASHRIVHLVPRATDVLDDETLTQRVESQLFRDRHIPKGDMNITAEHGTIILRGELESMTEIVHLAERVRRMPGVRGVQNLLHPYGTPAPNKERSRVASTPAPGPLAVH
jgi:osmotically-inducible protein OsmY